jgi:hypothetical protein
VYAVNQGLLVPRAAIRRWGLAFATADRLLSIPPAAATVEKVQ